MVKEGGMHQRDSVSDDGEGGGRRLGLDVPAWSLAAITLFYVVIQALIMAGGDYKTAMRIVTIVDRVRLLSVAASAVAMILSPVAFMSYWTLTEGRVENNEFRHRICVGLAINILTLPFLPAFIAAGSLIAQLLVVLVDKDQFRGLFIDVAVVISALALLVVSFLAPGLSWEKQVIYLKYGEPVVGPVLGDLDTRVAVLDYRVETDEGVYEYRENEVPKITMVPKDKITKTEFCDGGPFNIFVKPLYHFAFGKKDRVQKESLCSRKMKEWNDTYGRN